MWKSFYQDHFTASQTLPLEDKWQRSSSPASLFYRQGNWALGIDELPSPQADGLHVFIHRSQLSRKLRRKSGVSAAIIRNPISCPTHSAPRSRDLGSWPRPWTLWVRPSHFYLSTPQRRPPRWYTRDPVKFEFQINMYVFGTSIFFPAGKYKQHKILPSEPFLSVQFGGITCMHTAITTLHPQNSFHLAKWQLCPLSTLIPIPPPDTHPPATTVLLSVSMNLTTLGTSYKWNRPVFVLLWLVCFTQHNVLKVHPCGSMCQNFLSF